MTKSETGMVNRVKEVLGYAPFTRHFTVKLKSLVEEISRIKNPEARLKLLKRIDQMIVPFRKDGDQPNEILEKAGRMMEEFKKESAIRILSDLNRIQMWIDDGVKEGNRSGIAFINKDGVRCFMNDGAWETISPLLEELILRRKEEP